MDTKKLQKKITIWLWIFVAGLVISGLTAIPLRWEANLLDQIFSSPSSPLAGKFPGLASFIGFVREGLYATFGNYPFMAYGTDWLAFAHIVIAIGFLGPIKDPVKNIWVVELGMIACVLIIPWTLIFGPIRGI
ncbi:MAG: hypothetical protein OEZ02_12190, partial [Anaerolineae bacterium]|nr:hypothetical protein [Anaerolineae bacterium]